MPDGTDQAVLKTVGRYELLREIGRGGMAVVYLARQIELDRFVAIKELGTFHASDPTIARRFLRESRLAGSFTHTNIVTVLDYFEHEGTPYIAMEYIEGGSLRPYVANLTLAQIGGVLEGTLAGLAHAEERSVVHRDLKPENVMVTVEGRVKIADFGIAKATDRIGGASVLTQTGMTVGTPMYMAPEQALGQELGPYTDLYSLGCMAFELFAGRVPFADEAPMAILLRHINEDPPSLREIAPGIDASIADWVAELLAKDPANRPADANEAWMRFEEILLGLLGPRWRREARLVRGVAGGHDPGPPLTPAPFKREPGGTQYDSFVWGAVPGPATPPPHDSLGGPLVPGPIDVPVGPPTPEPFNTFAPSTPPRPPDQDLATPPGFERSGELAPPEPVETEEAETVAPEPVPADTAMPQRPLPAAPAPPRRRPRRRTGVLAGGVVAAGAVVAAAIVLAPSEQAPPESTPTPAAVRELAVDAGPLRLTATGRDWQALNDPPAIAGLALARGAAPAGDPARGAVLVGFGDASARRPELLSSKFVASLGLRRDVTPDRTEVRLGPASAYRYAGLRPIGSGRTLTVYVAPTSAGVATIACVQPASGDPAFAAECDRIARSLRLTGGTQPFALGASPRYGAAVDKTLTTLNRALERDRRYLRAAHTTARQARAARAIESDYRRARAALAGLDGVSPSDEQSRSFLVAALGDVSRTWGRIAAAAAGNHRRAYATAAGAARRAERRLATAVSGLRRGSYARLMTARFRTAVIPSLTHKKPHPHADPPGPWPQPKPAPPRPGPAPAPAPPRPAPTAQPARPAPPAPRPPAPAPRPRPQPTEPPIEG